MLVNNVPFWFFLCLLFFFVLSGALLGELICYIVGVYGISQNRWFGREVGWLGVFYNERCTVADGHIHSDCYTQHSLAG